MLDGQLQDRLRERLAAEARAVLVERMRVGFWINLLACAGFVVVDLLVARVPAYLALAVGAGQVALLSGALLGLRFRWGQTHVLGLAMTVIGCVCAIGASLAVVREDAIGYDMLLVAMTIGAAAFIPWTTGWQVALVVVASVCTSVADYFSSPSPVGLGDPLVVGVVISYLASICIAEVLRRERTTAQERDLNRQLAAAELAASGEQLRALSARLVSVQEEERTRIAREVHDELGQKLTALKFMVSALQQRAGPDSDVTRRGGEIIALLDSTLQSVQRISKSLRPGILDDLGFGAALTSLVNEFEERTGIECEIDVEDSLTVDRDGSTALYRILQEALTNVARHAGASKVWVSVRARDHVLELRVADNGRGLDASAERASSSLGILGMQERARACGGELEVARARQGGVLLRAKVPV